MEHGATYTVRLADGREFGPVTMDGLVQWPREGRVPRDCLLIPVGGGPAQQAGVEPALAGIFAAPPTVPGPIGPRDDGIAVIIPYRNAPALVGYYMGIAGVLLAFIPILGLVGPISAVVLGVKGLKNAKANPAVRGKVHAWIGILGGAFGLLIGGLFNAVILSSFLRR